MIRRTTLTRYVSPFGSPAHLPLDRAEEIRAQDTRLLALMREAGIVDERTARIGEPRVGDVVFRLGDLPEWQDGEGFDVIRPLVQKAERLAGERGEDYVVASRSGRSAAFAARLVIEGDDVRWSTRRRT